MNVVEYSCVFEGAEYSLYTATYRTFLNSVSITVVHKEHNIQVFVYPHQKKTVVSHTTSMIPSGLILVLYAFMSQNGHPFPSELSIASVPSVSFRKQREYKYKDTIIFSTETHSFRAVIKEEPYYYSVKIGGKEFAGCAELIVDKPIHPYYKSSKLAQVYSEPECWYQLGKKGKAVDLLKGSLQLCQMLFGVNMFYFDDNSNIECGITNHSKAPPRKLDKPFSLAHLSIAEKGMTWYEANFNAVLHNLEKRKEYQTALLRLQDPTAKRTDDFEAFVAINNLRKEQYDYLKPLYEAAQTWRALFDMIPKEKQCTMLNWLPGYMDSYILKFQPTRHEWYICLEPLGIFEKEEMCKARHMDRTRMLIQMVQTEIQQWGGKKRQNKTSRTRRLQQRVSRTRKNRTTLFSFSNQY